jgi:hypothetical protein
MILRTYGNKVEAVDIAFDAVAFESIGFRRNGQLSMSGDDFRAAYERSRGRELAAEAEGDVQIEVERDLLAKLEKQLLAEEGKLGDAEVIFIENQRGVDQPRTHEKKGTLVVEGENRLHFKWWIDPPLKIGVYRKR